MDNIKEIAGALIWISGILCTISIFICIIKIIFNTDEVEQYRKKVKNSLIALVLIFSVVNITNLIQSYFDLSELGIGKIPNSVKNELSNFNSNTLLNDKDKEGREIIVIDGIKCIVYGRNLDLYYKKEIRDNEEYFYFATSETTWNMRIGYKKANVKVDRIKPYANSQGAWIYNGGTAKDYALRISNNIYESNIGKDKDPSIYARIDANTNNSINCGELIAWTTSNGDVYYTSNIQKYNLD